MPKYPTLEERLGSKSLQENLVNLGTIFAIERNLQTAKTPESRLELYNPLAKLISDGNKDLYNLAIQDIEKNPEIATRYAKESKANRTELLKPVYEANKDAITQEVINQIKSEIKDDKYVEATIKLAGYFQNLVKYKDLDQNSADQYARKDAANALGVSRNYSAIGSIDEYQDYHKTLQVREFASQYFDVEQDKEGKIKSYKLNEDKFKEAMKDIETGAVIYTNAKTIQAYKAKAEAKKKEK